MYGNSSLNSHSCYVIMTCNDSGCWKTRPMQQNHQNDPTFVPVVFVLTLEVEWVQALIWKRVIRGVWMDPHYIEQKQSSHVFLSRCARTDLVENLLKLQST